MRAGSSLTLLTYLVQSQEYISDKEKEGAKQTDRKKEERGEEAARLERRGARAALVIFIVSSSYLS